MFPQPEGDGLTDRGVAALRAMVRNRVLLDISHMRGDALQETFKLLDEELDPDCRVPLLATHVGYRFGKQEYMLDEATILQIKRRDGVIGLILAQHQLNDGLRDKTKTSTTRSRCSSPTSTRSPRSPAATGTWRSGPTSTASSSRR